MTDLDELFRPLIDEGARHREPIAAIEMRARDRQSRHRRQRAQYRAGAGFVAVALIAATVGIVHARGTGDTRRLPIATTTPPPTKAPAPTAPAGWTAYDYGRARISVPPGWTTAETCAPPGGDALVLNVPNSDQICTNPTPGAPVVSMAPLEPPTVHTPYLTNAEVNGIRYETVLPKCVSETCPSLIADVPVLGVAISFTNIADDAILKTLTYSTYARMLQQPFGSAPASWKTLDFGGYSIRVPRSWPVVDLSKTGFCYPQPSTVYVGTPKFAFQCAFRSPIQTPEASLQLARDAVGVANMPNIGLAAWHHNGLTIARHPVNHPFVDQMWFTIEGAPGRIELTLGLGLDAAVARGILGSVRAVKP